MDILRGVITAVLLLLFVGLWAATWSGRRKQAFDEAARLPLVEDEAARPEEEPR